MKVIKNYLYNVSYQVFVLLVPFITIPYLARVLGPQGVGINSYTNSIIQFFILMGSLGTNLYGNRQVAFVRDNKKKLSETFYEISLVRLITFSISFLLFGVFMLLNNEFQVYYLAQAISILAAMADIAWFFMGVENFAVTVLRNIVVKIATLILIFIFVKTSNDLLTYIFIVSLSLIVGNLTLFPDLKRYIYAPDFSNINIVKHIMPSLILFVPQISTQIYVIINKTLLGIIDNVQVSGFFDQSDKIVKMILAIVTATGTVIMPHVANAFAKGQNEKTKDLLYSSFSFVSLISIPMMFGLAAIASEFVPLFFTSKFNSVIPVMMVESMVIVFIAWNNVIGTQYLFPTNQTKFYTRSVIYGIIVNLIMDVPLIMIFGAIGAAIATVLSEFAVTAYQLWYIRSQINYHRLFEDSLKFFIAGIAMFIVVFFMNIMLKHSWIMIIFEVFVGIFIYIIFLALFKTKMILKIKKLILNHTFSGE